MKKINIGILGTADIAKRFLIPALQNSDKFSLIAIASRKDPIEESFSKLSEVKVYTTYDDLLKNRELDAIYIPLPNALHYEWVKKSLESNLHVLVEKTLACNYEEVVELNDLAKEKKLALFENFQFRFHAQLEYIQSLVKKGKIGELRNMRSTFGFPPFPNKDNIRYKKSLGGGALLDAGAYTLKISQIFLGENINVLSSSLKYDEELEVDIWGSAFLKQINGNLTSQVSFGFDNFYQCNIELLGSKGKIYTNRIFTSPPDFSPVIEIETKHGIEKIKLKPDNHFKNMLEYFYRLIIENKECEYNQNVNQSRLIKELKEISIGK